VRSVLIILFAVGCGDTRRGGNRILRPHVDAGRIDTGFSPPDGSTADAGFIDAGFSMDAGFEMDAGVFDSGARQRSLVYEVKQGLVADGAEVSARGLSVTGVSTVGFYAQVSPSSDEYDPLLGAERSGIFVYTGANAVLPAIGDGIDMTSAKANLFYGQWQLDTPIWSATSAAAPSALSIDEISAVSGGADTIHEGVLVRITGLVIASTAPVPGAGDTAMNEVETTSGLRIDDGLGHVLAPFPSVGTTYSAITGVLAWRNEHVKLLPRSSLDIVP
jgi:hypothetical protein